MLGPIEVRRDGETVPVPGGRTSELLVRLALEAGVLVRAERLIEDLWGEEAPTTSRNTLQSKIAMLRRALGDPTVIATGPDGYRLDVDPLAVDALVVLRESAAAVRLLDEGDLHAAADLCASTLPLFRGDVLPAAGDGDWVAPHRARLDEARTTLRETGFAARLQSGAAGDLVGELEAAVRTDPYQEGLWELLITAQYRAGRQADALAAFQRVRTLLADDLGLDPGPALQALEQQILRHDAALRAPAASGDGGGDRGGDSSSDDGARRPVPAGNLPSITADLVGRTSESAAVSALVASHRLVEIVGPGGVGKTALAVAVGRRLAAADTVWLARLETAVTANDVVDTLIAALNVPGEAALLERLRIDGGVVLLDNCEHVVDAAADLAVRLLDAAPGLHVLCTSQLPLDVPGEAVFELDPLPLGDAVELFHRRAGAQRAALATDGERAQGDAVADLCRSLDGLPLAIELAAARTKTLSIEQISRRLDDRFQVLSDPSSRRPERRRALKATIRWSYDLLFPDDQRGLWALATFSGGAPLAAVESVLGALGVPEAAAIDVVGRLASRSLVTVDGEGVGTPPRYRLLDSIRAYALEAMGEAGHAQEALAAHAAWYGAVAADATAGVRSADQAGHLAFARTERANIDAALAWCAEHDPALALQLVNGFGWAWVVLGDSRGAARALLALEAVGDEAPAADRASALLLAAWIEASTDHLESARAHLTEARWLAEAVDDVDLRARCAYYLAYVVSHDGRFREALDLTEQSRALYEGLDRAWDQAANALFAARAAISAGDQRRSVEERDRVEHWLRSVDDPWLHVRQEAMLGELARIHGRFDDAVHHIRRAATTSQRLGFQQTEAYQVSSLGRALCQAGDYEAGAETLALAADKAGATGDVRMVALARVHLGRVLRALGRTEEARAALEAASAFHRDAGGGEQARLGDCLLAALDASGGEAAAGDRLASILADARAAGDAPVEVFALDALARLAAADGDGQRAAALLQAADERMAGAAHFITDRDRVDRPA